MREMRDHDRQSRSARRLRRRDPWANLSVDLTMTTATVVLTVVPLIAIAALVKFSFLPLHQLDKSIATSLHTYALAHPDLTKAMEAWSAIFGPWPWRVEMILLAAWALWRGSIRVAAWVVTAIVLSGALGYVLKVMIARARPVFPDPVATAVGESFPSGHALMVTVGVGATVLMLLPFLSRALRVLAWTLAALLVLSVVYTRIALGVHWTSDVVSGVLLGVAVLSATTVVFETGRRIRARVAKPSTAL